MTFGFSSSASTASRVRHVLFLDLIFFFLSSIRSSGYGSCQENTTLDCLCSLIGGYQQYIYFADFFSMVDALKVYRLLVARVRVASCIYM